MSFRVEWLKNMFRRKPIEIPKKYDIGYTKMIIQECQKAGLLRNQCAYILATAKWETNHTFKPVIEAYWLDEEWRSRNLRYYPWYGRGFVQLTWKANYERASRELGIDFIQNPSLATHPDYAAKILVKGMVQGWFTGARLGKYVNASQSDYVNARYVVNGRDKAQQIARIAVEYDNMLKEAGYWI